MAPPSEPRYTDGSPLGLQVHAIQGPSLRTLLFPSRMIYWKRTLHDALPMSQQGPSQGLIVSPSLCLRVSPPCSEAHRRLAFILDNLIMPTGPSAQNYKMGAHGEGGGGSRGGVLENFSGAAASAS